MLKHLELAQGHGAQPLFLPYVLAWRSDYSCLGLAVILRVKHAEKNAEIIWDISNDQVLSSPEMYKIDNQKNDPKFYSERHRQASSKTWTMQKLLIWNRMDLFWTVCVGLHHLQWDHHPWDKTEELVDITRDKFKKADGRRRQPDVIEYLYVNCDQ